VWTPIVYPAGGGFPHNGLPNHSNKVTIRITYSFFSPTPLVSLLFFFLYFNTK
jgi:hypothetical protein